jgi:hypothetical protein
MDDETINLLRTGCVAGRVCAAFDGACEARLEELVEHGSREIIRAFQSTGKACTPVKQK